MLIGRYGMIVPILAIAGSMAAKRRVAPSLGHVPDDRARSSSVLLIGVVIIVGALTFFPALVAGPDRRAAPPERRKGRPDHEPLRPIRRPRPRHAPLPALRDPRRREADRRAAARRAASSIPDLLRAAIPQAFRKLDPRLLITNPVMFVVEITAVLVTLIVVANVDRHRSRSTGPAGLGFQVQIAIWLWFTVLFATYAEAVAEARGRAQAATLRKTRSETTAHRRRADGTLEDVGSSELRKGDIIVVEEGETIPGDGDVIEGVGFVNEAAITGESAPVLKEPGTDIRSSVTGGTTLVSDQLVDPRHGRPGRDVPRPDDRPRRGRQAPAHAERDRARRSCSPGLTIVFLMATVTLRPFGDVRRRRPSARRAGRAARLPHPDDDRRPAVGDRHRRHGPRRALQRAGDERPRRRGLGRRRRHPARQDRHDHLRQPARRVDHAGARRRRGRGRSTAALVASIRDETPEGRSIVELARDAARRARRAGRRPATTPASQRSDATIAEEIAVPRRDPHERRRARPTAALDPQGRGRRHRRRPRRRDAGRGRWPRPTRSPTAGATPLAHPQRRPRPRPHRAQGHRQGGPRRAVRRVPPDGHPDGDDHRRQPADGGDDRPRGRRRRLHRRGQARGQDRLHPRASRPTATSSR